MIPRIAKNATSAQLAIVEITGRFRRATQTVSKTTMMVHHDAGSKIRASNGVALSIKEMENKRKLKYAGTNRARAVNPALSPPSAGALLLRRTNGRQSDAAAIRMAPDRVPVTVHSSKTAL